jgi:hypothetical protein
MPVLSSKVTVPNGTAVRIVAPDIMSQEVAISNSSTTDIIYIDGAASVSSATGFPLKKEESISITLGPGDGVFGIAAADGVIANVIVVKQD